MKNSDIFFLLALMITGCKEKESETAILVEKPEGIATPEGMVWIPGGELCRELSKMTLWPWTMKNLHILSR